jgi:TRAP-type C4-dicarboxylate transport system permease small subunit
VLVDFLTAKSSDLVRESLDAFGALLVGVTGSVFAWRLAVGAQSLAAANDQTTILAIPTWYAVALMVPSFALLGLTGFYTAWRHWSARRRGGAHAGMRAQ